MLEVAIRITNTLNGPDAKLFQVTKDAALELLQLLETKIETSVFIGLFSQVQRSLESRRAERKRKFSSQAISDPQQFAQRKVSSVDDICCIIF